MSPDHQDGVNPTGDINMYQPQKRILKEIDKKLQSSRKRKCPLWRWKLLLITDEAAVKIPRNLYIVLYIVFG